MTEPMSGQRLAEIRGRHDAYVASHAHDGAFACCTAHTSADDVPALLAEVERLRQRLAAIAKIGDGLIVHGSHHTDRDIATVGHALRDLANEDVTIGAVKAFLLGGWGTLARRLGGLL